MLQVLAYRSGSPGATLKVAVSCFVVLFAMPGPAGDFDFSTHSKTPVGTDEFVLIEQKTT